ncbi:transcription initiation factor IIB [Nitrososphaera sp. AFS]|nr:transcription initiation factor IIB [Nitrososphaera sp. AFS]NAL78940.1 transcription initiation factor IIB [Nitrososphaera sp. AFS]
MKAEWNGAVALNESEIKARTGLQQSSLASHDMGLSTVIGKENIDASKKKIEPSILSSMQRLRIWDFRTQVQSSSDKSLRIAFSELGRLKDKLGLSEAIVEKAAYIFRKAHQKGKLRGRSIPAVMAASIYIACRQMEASRTLDDIAAISNVKRKAIAKYHRELVLEFQIELPEIDSAKCISRVANNANITEKTKHHAINLMNLVIKQGISAGKDPMGLAAAVLYTSCVKTGEEKSQMDLANAAQTADATVRNRVKDLKKRLELNK